MIFTRIVLFLLTCAVGLSIPTCDFDSSDNADSDEQSTFDLLSYPAPCIQAISSLDDDIRSFVRPFLRKLGAAADVSYVEYIPRTNVRTALPFACRVQFLSYHYLRLNVLSSRSHPPTN